MYKLLVYKKTENCPACKTLDMLTPRIKSKYPQVEWEYVLFDENNPITLPDFVRSFPTSVLSKDGEVVFIEGGYENLAKLIHEATNEG